MLYTLAGIAGRATPLPNSKKLFLYYFLTGDFADLRQGSNARSAATLPGSGFEPCLRSVIKILIQKAIEKMLF